MKHLFNMVDIVQDVTEPLEEGIQVLLQGQPFSDQVKVFVEIGTLAKSKDLANQIGQYVHGRRWAIISRNDGHYIEITVEDHDDKGTTQNDPNPNQST